MCERFIDQLLLTISQWGTQPATQAYVLMESGTSDLSVRRLALNPLSHTSQGDHISSCHKCKITPGLSRTFFNYSRQTAQRHLLRKNYKSTVLPGSSVGCFAQMFQQESEQHTHLLGSVTKHGWFVGHGKTISYHMQLLILLFKEEGKESLGIKDVSFQLPGLPLAGSSGASLGYCPRCKVLSCPMYQPVLASSALNDELMWGCKNPALSLSLRTALMVIPSSHIPVGSTQLPIKTAPELIFPIFSILFHALLSVLSQEHNPEPLCPLISISECASWEATP